MAGGTDPDDRDDFTDEESTRERAPDERRGHPRIAAELCVRYRTLDDLVVAYTADISRGGMFITTRSFLPIGSVVRVELALPDETTRVQIIARIAYVLDTAEPDAAGRSHGMGIEFLEVDGPPLAEQLSAYLSASLGDEDDVSRVAPATIVVVDDDRSYRDRASLALGRKGHRVSVARHGLEALGMVLRDPPDLLVSDVQMPHMDGWNLLRLLRARPSVAHLPVVFLTTLGSEEDRLRGYRLGVDDYIAKPFQDDELCARVARVLARSRVRPRTTANKNALRGDLTPVSLPSVLSFVTLERRTGLLLLVNNRGMCTLHIRNGDVVHVDLGHGPSEIEGIDRLYMVLDQWTSGRFEFSACDVSVPDSIGVSTEHALLDHARRDDERTR